MTKAKITFIIVLLMVISFVGGLASSLFFVGRTVDRLREPFVYSDLEERTIDIMEHFPIVYSIDSGKVNKAKEILDARVDYNIVIMEDIMQGDVEEEDRRSAIKYMQRIKKHREVYPSSNINVEERDKAIIILEKYDDLKTS